MTIITSLNGRRLRLAAWVAVLTFHCNIELAVADTVQTVRLVPDGLTPAGPALTDRELPAGEAFDLEVEGTTLDAAFVEVWPEDEWACDDKLDSKKLVGTPQYYQLAMIASGSGADRVLRARIPPLQIARNFCIRLTPRAQMRSGDIERFAKAFVARLTSKLNATTSSVERAERLSTIVFDSQVAAFRDTGISAEPLPKEVGPALIESSVNLWVESNEKVNATVRLQAESTARFTQSTEATKAALEAAQLQDTWVFDATNRILLPDDVKTGVLSADENAAVKAVLNKARTAYETGALKNIDKWLAALQALAAAGSDEVALKTAKETLAKLPSLPQTRVLYVPGKSGLITITEFASDPLAHLATVQPMLKRLAGASIAAPLQRTVEDWLKLLESLESARSRTTKAEAAADDAKKAQQAARAALVAEVQSKMAADKRLLPTLKTSPVLKSSRPGKGATASVGNYVTPAVGVVLAIPTRDSVARPWAFPYFGLSFYFAPVDRKIPLGDLTGSFSQRFSITAAISLKDVSLPNADAEPVIFDGFPYLGVGFRLTQFVQGNLGLAVYRYRNANPVSEAIHWGVAPGIGVAVDLDVISVVSEGMSGL